MDDPDIGPPIEALPILGARLESAHRPTLARLDLDTRQGTKIFLAQRHQLIEIGQAMLQFAEAMPDARRPS